MSEGSPNAPQPSMLGTQAKLQQTFSRGTSRADCGTSAPVRLATNTCLTVSHLLTAASTVRFSSITFPPLTA